MHYVFTNNRRSLQKIPLRAALQTKQNKKEKKFSNEVKSFYVIIYCLVNVLCIYKYQEKCPKNP